MNTFHRRTGQIQGRRFWQDHIEGLAKSGSSRSAYCRRHQLSYHALTYWLRKQSQPVAEAALSLVEVPLHLAGPCSSLKRADPTSPRRRVSDRTRSRL